MQSFYDWLEAEEKLGKPFKEVVKNLSKSADEDIYNKMDHIMLEITEKVCYNLVAKTFGGFGGYAMVVYMLINLPPIHQF